MKADERVFTVPPGHRLEVDKREVRLYLLRGPRCSAMIPWRGSVVETFFNPQVLVKVYVRKPLWEDDEVEADLVRRAAIP